MDAGAVGAARPDEENLQASAMPAYDARMGRRSGVTRPVRRMTVFVRGRVQGVGFRWWGQGLRALELGLSPGTPAGPVRRPGRGRRRGTEAVVLRRLMALLEGGPRPLTRRPGRVVSVSTPLWAEPGGRERLPRALTRRARPPLCPLHCPPRLLSWNCARHAAGTGDSRHPHRRSRGGPGGGRRSDPCLWRLFLTMAG